LNYFCFFPSAKQKLQYSFALFFWGGGFFFRPVFNANPLLVRISSGNLNRTITKFYCSCICYKGGWRGYYEHLGRCHLSFRIIHKIQSCTFSSNSTTFMRYTSFIAYRVQDKIFNILFSRTFPCTTFIWTFSPKTSLSRSLFVEILGSFSLHINFHWHPKSFS